MADNFVANAGSGGDTFAADEITAVKYPRSKISLGADGSAADAEGGAGAVGPGVQRVTLASDDPAVVDLAAIEVLQTTISGDTTSLDSKVTACNTGAVVVSSSALPSGASTAANQSTGNSSLSTIAGDTTSLDSKVTACNTGAVVVSAALPAGTNAIGKLSANSGVDIGDVDVTSVIPGVGATNLGKAEDAGHTSGDVGVMALGVRQNADGPLSGADLDYEPLQTDANGFLKVNIKAGAGSGGTASTDDAAFTAGSGQGTPMMGFATSDNVDAGDVGVVAMDISRNLKVSLEASNATVTVDGSGVTQPVSAASLPLPTGAATSAAQLPDGHNVTIDNSTGAAAVNIQDGGNSITVDAASLPLPTGASTSANQTTGNSSLSTIAGAVSGSEMQVDVVAALPAGTNAIGKLSANSGVDIGDVDVTSLPGSIQGPSSPTIDSYSHVAINLTTGANQVLVSSAPNKQIWVYGYGFTCGDADGQSVSLQDEDDTAVTGIMEFAQYGGISVPPSGNFSMPIFKLGTDKDLEVDITGGDVDGFLAYAVVSV